MKTTNIMLLYIKKYKSRNIIILGVTVIQDFLLLVSMFLTMASARLVMAGDLKKLMINLLATVVLYLILHLIFWSRDVLIAKAVALINQDMRADLNRKLMGRSTEEFLRTDTGEYLSWYINDIKEAEGQGIRNVYEILDCVIKLIFAVVTLAVIRFELLFCTLIVTSLIFLLSRRFGNRVTEASKKVSAGWEVFTNAVKEQISGLKVLKYFDHTWSFEENIGRETEKLENQRCTYVGEQEKAALKLNTLNSIGSFINNLILFGMCTLRIIPPEIFFGGGNLINQVKNSLIELSQYRILLAGAKPYFQKLALEKQSEEQMGTEEERRPMLPEIHQSIQVKELSFGYGDNLLFQNLNMDFRIGGKYAIVGKSGCGKSTLLKLLLGQLTNYSGSILYDGQASIQYDPASVYARAAYIEQNVFLFHTSIRDNITLGRDFSDQDMENALRKSALLQDMDHFSEGLDTNVGENGKNLSGGQKQRIAIARALIYDRSILIVDEGTSALDKENAFLIEESLLGCEDLTLILVSHHLDPKRQGVYTEVYNLSEKGRCAAC